MASLPVWFLSNGQSSGSAVLVNVRRIGGGNAEQRLLTAQHVLRLRTGPPQEPPDESYKLIGAFSKDLKAWPPGVGYNDGSCLQVEVDTALTPDETIPLRDPEDLAFLKFTDGSTGCTPTGLLSYSRCAPGLQKLDIFGYIGGKELIQTHNFKVEPAPYRSWEYNDLDAVNGVGILVGPGGPDGGVSGGGVFLEEQYVGIYRGFFPTLGQHIFLPLTRIRDWLASRDGGWELVDLSVAAQVITVSQGMVAMKVLDKDQRVKDLLAASSQQNAELKATLIDFTFCKLLHDVLHSIQLTFQDLSTSSGMGHLRSFQYSTALRTIRQWTLQIDEIFRKSAATRVLMDRERVWVDKLRQLVETAQGPVFSLENAADFCDDLQPFLQRDLPSLNGQLFSLARSMKLQELSALFGAVAGLPGLAAAEVLLCREGQDTCLTLRTSLLEHVEAHNRWQELDDMLWLAQTNLAHGSGKFSKVWKSIFAALTALLAGNPSAAWAVKLLALATAITDLQGSSPGAPAAMPFAEFSMEARERFFQVDQDLKDLALKISLLSTPLEDLI